ncbi:sugar transferase [Microbacterium oryzae]|uniref:sugar transferase n=1 Tax=Microbacterium oryzae TaxID=743009 RepID=UPI0025AF9E4D|nr:sugar transferase [Microbacterium oryzae]MDN3311620.1 sugar transferase [Microbacterium oryzae]
MTVTDTAVLLVTTLAVQLRSPTGTSFTEFDLFAPALDELFTAFSLALALAWSVALGFADSRSPRVTGQGLEEYRSVVSASLSFFGVVALLSIPLGIDLQKGYLLLSLPIGVLLLIGERVAWRAWLRMRRRRGELLTRVLLVGSATSVARVARELRRVSASGYRVVGACVPTGEVGGVVSGTDIPVMGSADAVDRALEAVSADTVVVTSTEDLPPDKVKRISWALETGRQHLVLAPGITDIAGPRIHTRPVAGLPLIHVETPRFSAGQRVAKRALDLFGSLFALVLAGPLMLVITIAVKLTSPGPVLFRQTRVGLRGRPFQMFKFRSMVADAERQLDALLDQQDHGNTVMFKMKSDPRVTRVGRFLRRFSLDELPQLFNVLGGSMSLVGPRPPLPREVERYATHVHRRFLVKPGITGLWQVSGRSSLSWEDTVRLDLSYVENWNLVGDLIIVAKTARAALTPGETAT